ncbi:uncharacterized protein LOC103717853 isoform X4 [Phoenix dactylifera]|uniref:Uncharacterized protein LOC103717853 isoform X4 n=1 Tax=Phoenix dactylifera TaxID=42345 RepID=A0A8B9A6K9_PHODC|nr:uncharacterized protein LOC103717853 isoform X4 [Phoenix dactylifera]
MDHQVDQLGSREMENGLAEAVAVHVSTMPRMCPRPQLATVVSSCTSSCNSNNVELPHVQAHANPTMLIASCFPLDLQLQY